MNKKHVLAFVFISGLLVTVFLRVPSKSKDDVGSAKGSSTSASTAKKQLDHKKNVGTKTSPSAENSNLDQKPAIDSIVVRDSLDHKLDKVEQDFVQVDKAWRKESFEKFKKLGLSAQQFEKYQTMREEFEQEALGRLEDFHQKMEENKGKNYTYRLTEFDDKVLNQLRKEYNDRLSKVVGEEAIREIVKLRDEYNEKLKRQNTNTTEDIVIDF